ncbi:MAG: hypothetical protein FK734_10360 [Asgard group archaeon]|nr:hypothetical protein [Asgard group archaeon]
MRFGKFIGWLFFFAMQAAFDTFVIWGLVTYGESGTFISDKTTIILIAVPTIIVINILLAIPGMIFSAGMFKKKDEEKKFKMPDKVSSWFRKEDTKEEDIERWFKENITEEKIAKWFKEKTGEDS